jgi:3-oxoacyl-[acyl-carrier-protein] synthase-1
MRSARSDKISFSVRSLTTKATGHTLGAAGIIELGISLLSLTHQQVPQNLHLHTRDSDMNIALADQLMSRPINRVLSNSFGFGGSNCSLIAGVN